MARVKTFTAWGGDPALAPESAKVRPDDLNGIQDDYERSFSMWRPVAERRWALAGGSSYTNQLLPAVLQGSGYVHAFPLDPAWLGVAPRATRLRLELELFPRIPSTVTVTTGLYPVLTWTGGGNPTPATLGGAVVTVAITGPPAAQPTRAVSPLTPFVPSAGFYVLALSTNAALPGAAADVMAVRAVLSYRLT